MAKKSNKTEHVLKLITKNDEAELDDDFFVINEEIAEKKAEIQPKIEPEIQPKIEQEIQPEIEPKIEPEIQPEIEPEIQPEIEPPIAQQVKDPPKVEEKHESSSDNLINIAEILAREKISLVMERMKVCTCQTCFNDVLALALNSLPTKYVTTDVGKQYFQADIYKKQYETDILAALTKACVRVKAAPRH